MATRQCSRSECGTCSITLCYSEGNWDFAFWFTVWPVTIPVFYARWWDLLILTDHAVADSSPISQHSLWYPVGQQLLAVQALLPCLQQMQRKPPQEARSPLPFTLLKRLQCFLLHMVDRQIKTHPESWRWAALRSDRVTKSSFVANALRVWWEHD